MNILIIDNSVDITGANNSIVKSSSSIASVQNRFVFVYPPGSKCRAKTENAGFTCYTVNFIEIRKRLFNAVFYVPYLFLNAWRIAKIAKKEKADIIHVNDIFNLCGITAKLFCRAKVITHVRRMPETFPLKLYRFWTRLHIKFADKIVAVSEANKKALYYSSDKITVVYNQPPLQETQPPYQIKQQLNKTVKTIYTASYIPGKGQNYAVEIINRASKDFPGWQFVLNCYGSEYTVQSNIDYKESLLQKSKEYNIEESTHFNGTTHEVERLVKESDVVFNLSDSESFSRTTLESLYYGVPIVATNVGGTCEMVLSNTTGILAEKGDIEGMYKGFKKLITDDDFRLKMSQTGYKYVREKFSIENTSYKLREIYYSLCNKK
jgi:glycosyltransferase involved in cell wall biosynthesis